MVQRELMKPVALRKMRVIDLGSLCRSRCIITASVVSTSSTVMSLKT
jgi:hypothetical protein